MTKAAKGFWDKVASHEIAGEDALAQIERSFVQSSANERVESSYSKDFAYDDVILKNHQLFNTQVLMGVTHISIALNAFRKAFAARGMPRLNKVTFHSAIKFEESAQKSVHARLDETSGDTVRFQNYFKADDDTERLSASGEATYSISGEMPHDELDLDAIMEKAGRVEDGSVFYGSQKEYGPDLFSLSKVYHLDDGMLGFVELSSEMSAELNDYVVHPAIFDAAYVNSLFAAGLEEMSGSVRVPLFVQSVALYGDVKGRCYCHTRLRKKTQELIITDNRYYDLDGKLIMVVEGMSIKRVPAAEALLGDAAQSRATGSPVPDTSPNRNVDGEASHVPPREPLSMEGDALGESVESYIVDEIKKLMTDPNAVVDLKKNFMDLGVDSSRLIEISQEIERSIGIELYPTLFFEYQNVKELTGYFMDEHKEAFAAYFGKLAGSALPVEKESFEGDAGALVAEIEGYVVSEIRRLMNDDSAAIDLHKNFMDLGVESSRLIEISQKIEGDIGIELYPTLFFEYQNVRELTDYFASDYGSEFAAYFGVCEGERADRADKRSQDALPKKSPVEAAVETQSGGWDESGRDSIAGYGSDRDIAVIGMAGRLAGSRNLEEFWEHLSASEDMIREIPPDRWNWREWFDENREAPNKTYSKWGSFLDDADKFDPLFFDISPRKAIWLDPQTRILQEVVYETFEDAGCAKSMRGSNTGVYVGACFQEYWDEVVRKRIPLIDFQHESSAMSSISCSVSYNFDLQGGSIPMDNACASSLTALHLACNAIRRGENDLAIVAGTNLLISPLHYVYFSRMQALSPTGRCHTFDAKADGYVPGEGVVALLLKPLKRAISDGNNIHAVIKGSAINHVGRSNNPTSPRPELQTKLLLSAWEDADILPETLTYLECHGTGTKLGDPIEINALKKAFKRHTSNAAFCAIGSAKAHVGHLEGAAGVASIAKVILQMKHRRIPTMPNFEKLNDYIKLDGSPFYVNDSAMEWTRADGGPLRAGVSAFGMTGNNAHVVLEEFIEPEIRDDEIEVINKIPNLFVLSAMNADRLNEYVAKMLSYFESHPGCNYSSVCYSLQTGREEMEARLAIIIQDIDDLCRKLKAYLDGNASVEGLYSGNVNGALDKEVLAEEVDLERLASMWVKGVSVDWLVLYSNGRRRAELVPLPTYPFERDSYWMPVEVDEVCPEKAISRIHDLLDDNDSTLEEQRYRKVLTGTEYYLRDHVVAGEKVLPGVAYLEIARLAGDLAHENGSKIVRLKDVIWLKPISVKNAEREVHVSLYPNGNFLEYEITSDGGDASIINAQGRMEYGVEAADRKVDRLDIDAIRKRCSKTWDGDVCYRAFEEIGLHYGHSFQVIEKLYSSESGDEVLSEISLPASLKQGFGRYVLHPSIMDGALQSTMSSVLTKSHTDLSVPFSLGSLEISDPVEERCYVHVLTSTSESAELKKFDISILNMSGDVLVRMNSFVPLKLDKVGSSKEDNSTNIRAVLEDLWNGSIEIEDAEMRLGAKNGS